jgi:hypothetical protein
MTANRQFAENTQSGGRSQGNLGQNKAAREQAADEKLEHMGSGSAKKTDKAKPKKKDRDERRSG